MSATQQEMTLRVAMDDSQYDADASSTSDNTQSRPSRSGFLSGPDHRSYINLEDASRALINASHCLTSAAHEYTIAMRQSAETNDDVINLLQLRQSDYFDYNIGVQELAQHVAYISAYMQRNYAGLQAIRGGISTEIQSLSMDDQRASADSFEGEVELEVEAANKDHEEYVEGVSDTSKINTGCKVDGFEDESSLSDESGSM